MVIVVLLNSISKRLYILNLMIITQAYVYNRMKNDFSSKHIIMLAWQPVTAIKQWAVPILSCNRIISNYNIMIIVHSTVIASIPFIYFLPCFVYLSIYLFLFVHNHWDLENHLADWNEI